MMTPLASPVDLMNTPGLDWTVFTPGQIDLALRQATNRVIEEIGWDPRESERTYAIRNLCYGTPIFLPARHVTAVAVNADGDDLTVEDDWWTEKGRVDIPRGIRSGVVTYTAGWFAGDGETPTAIPEAIQDACLAVAAEQLGNTDRLKSWTVDDASETYRDIPGVDLGSRLARYSVWAIA